MADKYAHMRPRNNRECRKQDGSPKIGMSREIAIGVAITHREKGDTTSGAYECPHCDNWHVGKSKERE